MHSVMSSREPDRAVVQISREECDVRDRNIHAEQWYVFLSILASFHEECPLALLSSGMLRKVLSFRTKHPYP